MGRRVRTRGDCVYCGREMTASGMTRHMQSCAERRKAIEQADSAGETAQAMFHLKVQDKYGLGCWLHLEMCGSAILKDLDHYLRRIWLECCGHLSAFSIQGTRYTQLFPGSFEFENEAAMDIRADRVFSTGLEMSYEYDFGSTTDLVIGVVGPAPGQTDHEASHRIDGPQQARATSVRDLRNTRGIHMP